MFPSVKSNEFVAMELNSDFYDASVIQNKYIVIFTNNFVYLSFEAQEISKIPLP